MHLAYVSAITNFISNAFSDFQPASVLPARSLLWGQFRAVPVNSSQGMFDPILYLQ